MAAMRRLGAVIRTLGADTTIASSSSYRGVSSLSSLSSIVSSSSSSGMTRVSSSSVRSVATSGVAAATVSTATAASSSSSSASFPQTGDPNRSYKLVILIGEAPSTSPSGKLATAAHQHADSTSDAKKSDSIVSGITDAKSPAGMDVFKRLPPNIKITGVGKSAEEIGEQVILTS